MSDKHFDTQKPTCGSGENGVPDEQILDKHAFSLRNEKGSSSGLSITPLIFALFVGGTLFWAGHKLSVSNTTFRASENSDQGGDPSGEGELANAAGSPSSTFKKGKKLYNAAGSCVTCHQPNGQGLATANFPPLANSEWVTGSEEIVTRIVLHGVQGPLKVGDKEYGLVPMVPTIWKTWPDEDIAAVISYVRNEWGNQASEVSPETVKRIREKEGDRTPWTAEELQGIE